LFTSQKTTKSRRQTRRLHFAVKFEAKIVIFGLKMQNQAAVEALYSATFVEDYLDCVENVPNDLQRHLSRLREFDLVQYSVSFQPQFIDYLFQLIPQFYHKS
jgi:uncharacterized protein YggL (DUF469 family)